METYRDKAQCLKAIKLATETVVNGLPNCEKQKQRNLQDYCLKVIAMAVMRNPLTKKKTQLKITICEQ
jgi:hypothetical protein